MDTNKISLNILVLSTIAVILIEIATRFAISQDIFGPLTGLGLARFAQILALVFISMRKEEGLASIGIERSKLLPGLVRGLCWSAGFGIAAGLIFLVLFFLGIDALKLFQTQLPINGGNIIFFLGIGALLGPIAEEIFFRGIFYGYLRRWGIPAALIISTIFFVLPHSIDRGIPVTQIMGGLVFAVSYELEKNLVVPIVIHCLGNLAIFTLGILFT